MDLGFYIFLFIAGALTGVFSGLLGIGGALIIIPVLLYVPAFLGLHVMSLHVITGIAAMQTTFGTLTSAIFHRQTGNVKDSIVFKVGFGVAAGAITGAILSKFLSALVLMWIYALFMAVAASLILIRKEPGPSHDPPSEEYVPAYKGIIVGVIAGLPSGALGFAGSVIIIPLLNTIFRVPMKICISTGTHIAFLAALMSLIGKMSTGQIEIISAVIISVSATLGAYGGTMLNKKANPAFLRYLLLVLILLTLGKVLYDIAIMTVNPG
jgi:hypothetical protein